MVDRDYFSFSMWEGLEFLIARFLLCEEKAMQITLKDKLHTLFFIVVTPMQCLVHLPFCSSVVKEPACNKKLCVMFMKR